MSPARRFLDVGVMREPRWRITLLGLGGLALFATQAQLRTQQVSIPIAIGLAVGVLLWLGGLVAGGSERDGVAAAATTRARPRRSIALVAVALGLVVWLTASAGVYTAVNVTAWVGAVIAWCTAWWPRSEPGGFAAVRRWPNRRSVMWLASLALVMAVGAVFRFHALDAVPAQPTSDHAEKLLDVADVLSGELSIFFPRNTGREPAQFYATAALMRAFDLPLTFDTLKLGTALVGLLAIPAVFLLATEVGGRGAGVAAAALFAAAKWPVALSRIGLRFPYAVLATAVVVWLLVRYLERGDRRDALLCGVAIGLGLHGYTSFRVVPLLVPLGVAVVALGLPAGARAWRARVADVALIAGTALVACLPLARYAVAHPEQVFERARSRAAGGLEWEAAARTFLTNNVNAALAFNWRGDSTWVNAVRFDPLLDVVTGAALLAGIATAAYRAIVQRDTVWSTLLLSAPILALPSTLSLAFPHENPSANRLSTLAPLVFALAGLPFGVLARAVVDGWGAAPGRRRLTPAVGAVALLALAATVATENHVTYFSAYDRQYRAAVPDSLEPSRTLLRAMQHAGVDVDHVYFLGYPHWIDGRNVGFALGRPGWWREHDINPDHELPRRRGSEPMLFLLHGDDRKRLAELRARFPEGSVRIVPSVSGGAPIGLYIVPAR